MAKIQPKQPVVDNGNAARDIISDQNAREGRRFTGTPVRSNCSNFLNPDLDYESQIYNPKSVERNISGVHNRPFPLSFQHSDENNESYPSVVTQPTLPLNSPVLVAQNENLLQSGTKASGISDNEQSTSSSQSIEHCEDKVERNNAINSHVFNRSDQTIETHSIQSDSTESDSIETIYLEENQQETAKQNRSYQFKLTQKNKQQNSSFSYRKPPKTKKSIFKRFMLWMNRGWRLQTRSKTKFWGNVVEVALNILVRGIIAGPAAPIVLGIYVPAKLFGIGFLFVWDRCKEQYRIYKYGKDAYSEGKYGKDKHGYGKVIDFDQEKHIFNRKNFKAKTYVFAHKLVTSLYNRTKDLYKLVNKVDELRGNVSGELKSKVREAYFNLTKRQDVVHDLINDAKDILKTSKAQIEDTRFYEDLCQKVIPNHLKNNAEGVDSLSNEAKAENEQKFNIFVNKCLKIAKQPKYFKTRIKYFFMNNKPPSKVELDELFDDSKKDFTTLRYKLADKCEKNNPLKKLLNITTRAQVKRRLGSPKVKDYGFVYTVKGIMRHEGKYLKDRIVQDYKRKAPERCGLFGMTYVLDPKQLVTRRGRLGILFPFMIPIGGLALLVFHLKCFIKSFASAKNNSNNKERIKNIPREMSPYTGENEIDFYDVNCEHFRAARREGKHEAQKLDALMKEKQKLDIRIKKYHAKYIVEGKEPNDKERQEIMVALIRYGAIQNKINETLKKLEPIDEIFYGYQQFAANKLLNYGILSSEEIKTRVVHTNSSSNNNVIHDNVIAEIEFENGMLCEDIIDTIDTHL